MHRDILLFCCVIVSLADLVDAAFPCAVRSHKDPKGYKSVKLCVEENHRGSNQWLEPFNGLKLNYTDKELLVRYSPRSLTKQGITMKNEDEEKKFNVLQRIGSFLAMIPVGMQLLHLPMAIASVKMSLIKSILIAKMALILLFLRALFMSSQREKVILVRAPPQYHEHYYHPYEDPEDNKPGWLGKTPEWMNWML